MKKLFALAISVFLYCHLSAQQTIYAERIGWRGKSIELHTISDKDKKQNCIILMNGDSIRVFVVDNNQKISREFHLKRHLSEKMLGGFIKDGQLYAFFRVDHDDQPHVHSWTFDLAGGQANDNSIPWEARREKLINRISCGDHLMFFAVNKKSSEFVLYDFKDGERYDTLHYHFADGVWENLTLREGFSRTVNVAKLDQEGESSVENAGIPNKVYLINDTLFLLMNGNRGITGIFAFKAQDKQVSYREIVHNGFSQLQGEHSSYKDNSYLLDGKLYFVSANSDSLDIQVRDFADGRLIREYSAAREENIGFRNTPIIQEGSAFSKESVRELAKTSQLVRKMLNGGAVIMAGHDDSNHVVLSVGSYTKVSSGGGPGAGMWMGTGLVGGAMSASVGVAFMPTGGFYRSTWTKSARFKMLLDENSFQQVPGTVSQTINERIEQYTKDLLIPPEGENLFVNSGKYIYGYYDRDEHALKLVQF